MMKVFTKVFSIVVLLALSVNSRAQSSEEAVTYMNSVTEHVFSLQDESWKYIKAVTRGRSARKVEKKRQDLVEETRNARLKVRKVRPFHGNSELKDAVLTYLEISEKILNEQYAEIVDLEEVAEQSYNAMEAYLLAQEKASEAFKDAFATMVAAQYAFGDEFNVEIAKAEETRRDKKMKRASEALRYYNKVYLIFFKCNIQEKTVLELLNAGKTEGHEVATQTLVDYAEEGLAKLDTMQAFDGDSDLIQTTVELMEFFKLQGAEYFPDFFAFQISLGAFKEVQAELESTKKKHRTKELIDRYNTASKEYNSWVEKYNKINQTTNKSRTKYYESWNKAVDTFFRKHAR